jgi:hypothetical protein
MDPFLAVVSALGDHHVRYVLIGVWGANLYATRSGELFTTLDRDLFLPPDAENLRQAWSACEATGFSLWSGSEPLDIPRDATLAGLVVARRAAVRAHHPEGLDVDLTLVMEGFTFEPVWRERRTFRIEEVTIPVARLAHIVQSKAAAGRDKDRLFLATHAEALRGLLERD